MGKKLLLIILLGMFLISFVSAIDCQPKIKTEIGIYNEVSSSDKSYFEKSLFQPMSFEGIIQEGGYLIIESFSFSLNNSCNLEESVIILLKNPEEDDFSSIAYIPLENSWEENGLIKYSFELVDLAMDSWYVHEDTQGKVTNCCAPKRLRVEGEWEMKVSYGKNEMHLTLFNENRSLPRKLDVRNRLSISQLETLKQLRDDSKRDSRRSLFVVIAIGLATIFLETGAIWIMMWASKKQLKKMDEHYQKQTKKEDKREEEKQLDLLRTLMAQLNFLKGNFIAYKKSFSGEGYPLYELWNIDISTYFNGLDYKIKGHETISLKENLMFIKDKLLLVNNFKTEAKKLEERKLEGRKNERLEYAIESIRKQVVKIIGGEILPVIEKSEKFIKDNFLK